ncbi:hypothetical protein WN51_09808 [Melipona quadrifasciata]|uniref:Uncharacterized protein n=1 Tax=Melipona quadrifasciata TaxID=166423 RepID=A0A0N0BIC1_9HYME|nr:hypothetical protein WN51_09808 [Melipona quadrifasciata]
MSNLMNRLIFEIYETKLCPVNTHWDSVPNFFNTTILRYLSLVFNVTLISVSLVFNTDMYVYLHRGLLL